MAENNENIENDEWTEADEAEYLLNNPIPAALQAEIDAKRALEKALEEKYADRGLKFTSGFRGSYPVQAFGIIDGYRFYFRYRNDGAAIRIGFIAEDRAAREYQRDMKVYTEWLTRLEFQEISSGKPNESARSFLMRPEPTLTVLNGIDDYPSSIRKEARLHGVFNDAYKGYLSASECEFVFTELIENLKDVEYEDPVTIDF